MALPQFLLLVHCRCLALPAGLFMRKRALLPAAGNAAAAQAEFVAAQQGLDDLSDAHRLLPAYAEIQLQLNT